VAVQASGVPTLLDVLNEMGGDGKPLRIAEVLTRTEEILEDVVWREGNTVTGHKDAVRTSLPSPSFRSINEGVPVTKGGSTQIEETCAMLEDFSQADRELALLHGGGIEDFRVRQAKPHMQGMAHAMAQHIFYSNAATNPKAFTGLAPRFNTLDDTVSQAAGQVIDAGGTGSDLRSIWYIGWSDETVFGLYPKGTPGGLQHEDMTGAENGKTLNDANGNKYVGYEDHWVWRCGMMVKDWRYVVRIANIDVSQITVDAATGPDIQDLMIQAAELIETSSSVRTAWYVPKQIRSLFRRQIQNKANANLSWGDPSSISGRKVLQFDESPVRRVDALNTSEEEVTA
jgi:hypothetical protein